MLYFIYDEGNVYERSEKTADEVKKKSQSKMLQKRQAFQLQLYPERLMVWVELGRKPEIMYWKFANAWPMYPVHSPAD